MKKHTTEKELNVLKEFNDILLEDSHTISEVDDDGDVIARVYFSPKVTFSSIVACAPYGYVLRTNFHVGEQKNKYELTKAANRINDSLREGAFCVDDDTFDLIWKSFIPYSDSIGARDVLRTYKTGIGSFLINLDEITEALTAESSEDGVTIIDVEEEDTNEC